MPYFPVNKIGSLRHFSACTKLVELHLRKNEVSDLGEVRPGGQCRPRHPTNFEPLFLELNGNR